MRPILLLLGFLVLTPIAQAQNGAFDFAFSKAGAQSLLQQQFENSFSLESQQMIGFQEIKPLLVDPWKSLTLDHLNPNFWINSEQLGLLFRAENYGFNGLRFERKKDGPFRYDPYAHDKFVFKIHF